MAGVPFRAGWLPQLHILRAISDHARFSVGEFVVVCRGWNSARVGSLPCVWQTAGLSRQDIRANFSHVGDIDVRFVFLRVFLRTAAGPAFDRSASSQTKGA